MPAMAARASKKEANKNNASCCFVEPGHHTETSRSRSLELVASCQKKFAPKLPRACKAIIEALEALAAGACRSFGTVLLCLCQARSLYETGLAGLLFCALREGKPRSITEIIEQLPQCVFTGTRRQASNIEIAVRTIAQQIAR